MTLRNLPEFKAYQWSEALSCLPGADAIEKWDLGIQAATKQSNVIEIMDFIGADDWDGGGITARSVSAALKGQSDVVININSPGGDFFEGVAIYNVLRAHAGKVTVNILSLAASAASLIAMAGDQINIAKSAHLMIHNVSACACGDRHDFADIAAILAPFDDSSADVYADRSGQKKADISAWMDNETYFNSRQAIEVGFANGLMADAATVDNAKARAQARPLMALRRVELMMIKENTPRSERRRLIQEIKGDKPSAVAPAMQDAGNRAVADALQQLIQTIKQ